VPAAAKKNFMSNTNCCNPKGNELYAFSISYTTKLLPYEKNVQPASLNIVISQNRSEIN